MRMPYRRQAPPNNYAYGPSKTHTARRRRVRSINDTYGHQRQQYDDDKMWRGWEGIEMASRQGRCIRKMHFVLGMPWDVLGCPKAC